MVLCRVCQIQSHVNFPGDWYCRSSLVLDWQYGEGTHIAERIRGDLHTVHVVLLVKNDKEEATLKNLLETLLNHNNWFQNIFLKALQAFRNNFLSSPVPQRLVSAISEVNRWSWGRNNNSTCGDTFVDCSFWYNENYPTLLLYLRLAITNDGQHRNNNITTPTWAVRCPNWGSAELWNCF